jgi:two-component system sensor histidine kinase RegB
MTLDHLSLPHRNMHLDTLIRLRWLWVIGQTVVVLVAHLGFEFSLPLRACLAVIALSASLNVIVRLRFRNARRLEPKRAGQLLGFDIVALTMLMYLTGGLANPFSFFFIGPVVLSATALPARITAILGTLAILCATLLVFFHYPLPWSSSLPAPILPGTYILTVWVSVLLAVFFIGIYAWQVTEESRQLVNALAATELVLAREQYLTQLDGLAAAAAHALGTPLATISVIARELEREIPRDSPHVEDVRLLREQAQRCRDILGKLSELPVESEHYDRLPLNALLEEVAAPHRNFGIVVDVQLQPDASQPIATRNPAVLYGLGNLVENAVDFARHHVEIAASWDADTITVRIGDDGPGFAPEIIDRIGDPYVRSRRRRRMYASDDTGLGLGFFIAKTLLERSGARLTFINRNPPEQGAVVTLRWPRAIFEQISPPAELENNPAIT